MKTNDEIHASKSLQEVWAWKEKAYEATEHLSGEQLRKHYEDTRKKLAALLGAKLVRLENGAYLFKQ